jgi:hypothetical protein
MKKILLFLCSLLVGTAAMQAQIIHVPGDYPTIQQGINAATPGDTILVAEGTYYEQISFKGKKPLMVASGFLIDGDTSHISNTIIDGSQITSTDSASVVYFVSGEDTTSILCGFTIQHGTGTNYTLQGSTYTCRDGGGVYISGSGARIIYNRITDNHLNDTLPTIVQILDGAGIACEFKEDDHWVVIDHNVIFRNSICSKVLEAWGAGLSIAYNTRLTYNTIYENTCTGRAIAHAVGAGFVCAADTGWAPITAIVQHNIIRNNRSETQHNFASYAGGLLYSVTGIYSDNEVANNEVNTGSSTGGAAGLGIYNPLTGSIVRNNIFENNISNLWSGGLHLESEKITSVPVLVENNYFLNNSAKNGGGFGTIGVPVTLQNNVFSTNSATSNGGAMFLWNNFNLKIDHFAILINNSIYDNSASVGGGLYSILAKPLVMNSIFRSDSSVSVLGPEICLGYSIDTLDIAYSNIDTALIHGNAVYGGGNINTDPLFTDLALLTTEHWGPCIDKGTKDYTCNCGVTHHCPGYDITGITRPAGIGYDMGAYDMKAWGQGVGQITNDGLRITNYPNPFVESTTFIYTLKVSSQVLLQIFNSFGQLVSEPVSKMQQKGEQKALWYGNDLPSGIYYYRIQAGEHYGTGKMVKF